MRKTILVLCAFLLVGCSSVKNDPSGNPLTEIEKQYEELLKYTDKRNVKCSQLLNAKQLLISSGGDMAFMLTMDGKMYDLDFKGGLYSTTNQNCAEWVATKSKKVDWIYNDGSILPFFLLSIKDNFREGHEFVDYRDLDLSTYNNKLVSKVNNYGQYMFLGSTYIRNNSVYYFDDKSKSYLDMPIMGLINGEQIEKYLLKDNRTMIITNFAIYTMNTINRDQCDKYVDIECKSGYLRDEMLTHIYSDLNLIYSFFDGQFFIDTNGDLYEINYLKIRDLK